MSQQVYLSRQSNYARSSIQLLDDTILQGIDTLEMLDAQGRQIDRIGVLEDNINHDVQDSKRIMASINHYLYNSTKIFRPSYWKKNKHQSTTTTERDEQRYQAPKNQIKAELERLQEENTFKETDDEFTEQVRPRLALLKEIALAQGNHLDSHNQKLGIINCNIEHTREDLNQLNTNIRKKLN